MQKYLKPNQLSTIEESQEIFRIRNKVTDVKENFKGMYDSIECFCCKEDESQKHIMECKFIYMNQNIENIPNYEKIFETNLQEQVKIAKKFLENMKIRKTLGKK